MAAAPAKCVDYWNADPTSLRFGRHVFGRHGSARAEVTRMEASTPNPRISAAGACAVIFSAPEWDREYGTLGLVVTDLGWAPMQELARDDQAELERIQDEAAARTNAAVFPDGTLEAD